MRVLTDADVAGLLDPDAARAVVRETLRQHAEGHTGLSEPRTLRLPIPGRRPFYSLKGALVAEPGVAGFRLGYIDHDSPGEPFRLIVLAELETGRPLALLSERTLYRERVAAMTALTVALFRHTGARTLALLGAGRLAGATLRAVQMAAPFDKIVVHSRSEERARPLLAELTAGGLPAAWSSDRAAACLGADVIITLTSADEPLVCREWLKPGALVVSAGGRQELAPEVILESDALFVDDWDQCLQLGDIAALHRAGRITRERVSATIGDVSTGRAPGRRTDDQRIVAIPQGLAVLDVALAAHVVRQAEAGGIGVAVEGM